MSTTVDSKVVEMKFDNKDFEQNVQTSMSTLEKLKQSLNFTGSTKGLENIGTAVKNTNLDGMGKAVETVQARFSAMQVVAMTALANITNSVINVGKRLVSSFTIDPVKSGFAEYETQINSVQTILANTSSKGTTLKQVNAALDELNHYADKTIYNFTEMTRNIGTFTAAGVDLKTSVSAIQGIANLAAVSGSTSQQASTAMYQLSQALASGTVKLQDWNSVVNAGMGGEVFQNALKETARLHGVAIDDMIKKQGSFRETLKDGWLTSEVLTETLSKFTTSGVNEYLAENSKLSQKKIEQMREEADASDNQDKAYKEMAKTIAKSSKLSESQVLEYLKMSKTAEDAATKVKTFTQLMDTLSEAAQSGWTQTWEILIGDFNEAKGMFTGISDVLSDLINKSAESRNNLLQEWKDLGGRQDILDSFKNVYQAILNVVKPIHEASREVFPPTTAQQLKTLSEEIKDFTSKLILSEESAQKVKNVFLLLFGAIKTGGEILKGAAKLFVEFLNAVKPVGTAILDVFNSIVEKLANSQGSFDFKLFEFLSNLLERVKIRMEQLSGTLQNLANKFADFISKIKIVDLFKKLGSSLVKVGSKIIEIVGMIGSALMDRLANIHFDNILDFINTLSFAGIAVGIKKFVDSFGDFLGMFSKAEEMTKKNPIVETLDSIKDGIASFQDKMKIDSLKSIATSIAILAGALFVLSLIDSEKLSASITAMTALFGDLVGAFAILDKVSGSSSNIKKTSSALVKMSVALLIMANALKTVAELDEGQISQGLTAITALALVMVGVAKALSTSDKAMMKGVGSLILFAVAIKLLAGTVKSLGEANMEEINKGLYGVGVLVAMMTAAAKGLSMMERPSLSAAANVIAMSVAIKILASACKTLGEMTYDEINQGLFGIATMLTALTTALNFMPKNMMGTGIGLIAVAAALEIIAHVMDKLKGFNATQLGTSLAAIGGSLGILAIALNLMKGTIGGAAALLVASAALAVLTPVLIALGKLSWEEIAKGLIALAGAFTIIGVAGVVLAPVVGTIGLLALSLLGISAAIALAGVGFLSLGVGIAAFATALAVGAVEIMTGIQVIVAGLAGLIPLIATQFAKGVVSFIKTLADSATVLGKAFKEMLLTALDIIKDCVPEIVETALTVIEEVLNSLAEHAPAITDALFRFVIGVINALADHIPEFVTAFTDLMGEIFGSVIDALNGLDAGQLQEIAKSILMLSGMTAALSFIAGMIPGAMAGLAGLGVVMTELAGIIAIFGGIAQIPGLTWLIDEGGDFLEKIGAAIGKFVGGIVGGVAKGVTSQLEGIGEDLSKFMETVKPFLDGAASISESSMKGVQILADTILTLTKSEILSGVTSWLTGGSSLAQFGEEIAKFAKSFGELNDSVPELDDSKTTSIENMAKMLQTFASIELPNSGGLAGLFAGNNDIDDFGSKIASLAKSFSSYVNEIPSIDDSVVTSTKNLAEMLKTLANLDIPNTGGLAAMFTGDNNLTVFGNQIKSFFTAVSGIDTSGLSNVTKGLEEISKMAKTVSEIDGSKMTAFAKSLTDIGKSMSTDFVKFATTNAAGVKKAGEMLITNYIAGIRSKAPMIKTVISSVVNTAVSGITKKHSGINAAGASIITSFVTGIDSKKASVTATIKSLNDSILKAVKSKGSTFKAAGESMVTALESGVKAHVKNINTHFASAMTACLNTVKGKAKAFQSAGQTLGQALANGMKSKKSTIANALSSAVSSGASHAKGYYGSYYSAGAHVGQGFVNGIRSKISAARAAASALSRAGHSGIKNTSDISSPSKVTTKFGEFFGEGFVNGITSFISKAKIAGSRLSQASISAVSNTVGTIGSILSKGLDVQPKLTGLQNAIAMVDELLDSDMDFQPQIRPVVDLSNVEAGASTINDLMRLQYSVGVGVNSNLSAVNQMMNNRRYQNDNSDVVSAIDKLRFGIDNMPRNTYTFGDVTYDDGGAVSDAVGQLIRAIRINGRM